MPQQMISLDASGAIDRAQDEFNKHHDAAAEIVAKADRENRNPTEDEVAAIADHQQKREKAAETKRVLLQQVAAQKEIDGEGEERRTPAADPSGGDAEADQPRFGTREYRSVFNRYVRHGGGDLTREDVQTLRDGRVATDRSTMDETERRAQSAGNNAGGGFTVPRDLSQRITEARKAYDWLSRVGSAANVITTGSGNTMDFPTLDDTAQEGEAVAENASATEQDATFGQVSLSAYKSGSNYIRISRELLDDSDFNIEAIISRILGVRLGRRRNRLLTTGTGSGQPQGIVTGASAGVTAASPTAIAYEELLDLKHSVDPAYRMMQSARWMFNDSTLLKFKKFKDADGRLLWQRSYVDGVPDRFDGDEYIVNQNMASVAASQRSVLFGALEYYMVRMVGDVYMYRLTEVGALQDQVILLGFERYDAKVIDGGGGAIKVLTQAAS